MTRAPLLPWLLSLTVMAGAGCDGESDAVPQVEGSASAIATADFQYFGATSFTHGAAFAQPPLWDLARNRRYVVDILNREHGPPFAVALRFLQLPDPGHAEAGPLPAVNAPRALAFRLPLATPRTACQSETCPLSDLDAPPRALIAEDRTGMMTLDRIEPSDQGVRVVFEYDDGEPPFMASLVQWCTRGCAPEAALRARSLDEAR